ncbi:NAD-dependent epimerase [Pelagibacteraceae bacterium]|nr:NAD-dependent epimerase [Pelagibacteraceae bacterium]
MKILVTGSAGFIGSALTIRLLERGNSVVGIDNHNEYYDPELKEKRLKRFVDHPNYNHQKIDLADQTKVEHVFKEFKPQKVVNLAAQAGVRYSMENPMAYVNSNIVGFLNILECCKFFNINHLVYASTSSVYGSNTMMPFSEHVSANHPLSFYAATKKSNELMAHTYSYLYGLPTTGLRFFTVYGPWGRPDMALFKFTKAILDEKPIDVFNYGKHTRDFTYIDDIVEGVLNALDNIAKPNTNWDGNFPDPASSNVPWNIYNIGNNKPVQLMDYIKALEMALGKKAKINFLPLQPGDVPDTFADVTNIKKAFKYSPNTLVADGVKKFVKWYKEYYFK